MATLQPKNNTNQDESEEPKEENPKKKEDNSKSGKSKQPKVHFHLIILQNIQLIVILQKNIQVKLKNQCN